MLGAALRGELVEHARGALPCEACGVLVGIDDAVTAVILTTNSAARPEAMWEISPDEQQRILETVRWEDGEDILAAWHSHPIGPPYPSGMDVGMAVQGTVNVIVANFDQAEPTVRAWLIDTASVPVVQAVDIA